MARPGIMLYFDILDPIKVLPDADKGRLLMAMLEYGKYGTTPKFEGMLALAWGFVKPKLDKDSAEYERTILKRQYATFCRDRKRKGEPEISFDEWVMTIDNQCYQVISNDIKWYPTTTTNPTTTITPSTTTAAAATTSTNETEVTAATADRKVKAVGGKLGKGVVFLSNNQIDSLLEEFGDIETFDYYVDKLSSFIIKNDAKVANHYETILKWYREDSGLDNK